MASSHVTSESPPIREYVVRLHDPVETSPKAKRMQFHVQFARSSTPPIVPRVGEDVDIGTASYAEAARARSEANRARVVTRVAHYLEIGRDGGDGYVAYVDVYTEWRPIRTLQ